MQWGAASGLSWHRPGRVGLLPGEDAVLAAMAIHDNAEVRAMAGRAAFLIGLSDTAAALDLLAKIESAVLSESPPMPSAGSCFGAR